MSVRSTSSVLRVTAAAGAAVLTATLAATLLPAPASAAPTSPPAAPLAPVSHPQDDHAGSTVAAHEGRATRTTASRTLAAGSTEVLGLDVSGYQANVAWSSVYANGGRFAYVKATESTTYKNPYFAQQYDGSVAAGLIRGAYHFALPDRSSGTVQADYFVSNGGGWSADGKTLPPMLDIEYNPYGATCYGLSMSEMVAWILAFSREVRARSGRYPTIYTTTDWWTTCAGNSSGFASTSPLFIARYSSTVGTLPAGWPTYTLWQFSDTGTFPGDQDSFNGAYNQLQSVALGTYVPPPASGWHDFTGDGHPDILGRTSTGELRLYYGNGTDLVGSRVIGIGWQSLTAVFCPGDFNGDGHPDVIARTSTGELWVYYWDGLQFSGRSRIGIGWNSITALFSAGDFTRDGHADIMARTSTGELRLYYGNGSGLVGYRVVGKGWNVLTAVFTPGDLNGDGYADVIARTSTGDLWAYYWNGLQFTGRARIGVGWASITSVSSVGDFNGDGHPDVLGRTSTGELRLYYGTSTGLAGARRIGIGWGTMTAIN